MSRVLSEAKQSRMQAERAEIERKRAARKADREKRDRQAAEARRTDPKLIQAQANKRVREVIDTIYAQDWKPTIDVASSQGKCEVTLDLDDGYQTNLLPPLRGTRSEPDKKALVKYGVRLLEQRGYKVAVHEKVFTWYERDGSGTCTKYTLSVSW